MATAAAKAFEDIPPLARSKVVAMVLADAAGHVDLLSLLELRKTLLNLGALLNQSLATSWGKNCDAQAASNIVKILREYIR